MLNSVETPTPAVYLRIPLAEAEAHHKTVADLRADNLRLCAKAAEVAAELHALRAQVRWSEIHAEELASLRRVVGACVGVLRNAGLLVDGFDWRHLHHIFAGLVKDLECTRPSLPSSGGAMAPSDGTPVASLETPSFSPPEVKASATPDLLAACLCGHYAQAHDGGSGRCVACNCAAFEEATRGTPFDEALPSPSPSPSPLPSPELPQADTRLFVVTRRDAHGLRFKAVFGGWGTLDEAQHYAGSALAEKAKPRGSKIWPLETVALLIEAPSKTKPAKAAAKVSEFDQVGEERAIRPPVPTVADINVVGPCVVRRVTVGRADRWLEHAGSAFKGKGRWWSGSRSMADEFTSWEPALAAAKEVATNMDGAYETLIVEAAR